MEPTYIPLLSATVVEWLKEHAPNEIPEYYTLTGKGDPGPQGVPGGVNTENRK